MFVNGSQTYGKTDLLPEVCVNHGRQAAKAPTKAPAESSGAEANKTASSGGAGASDKPKSENQSGYIKTYKKLLQETEKWPILWDWIWAHKNWFPVGYFEIEWNLCKTVGWFDWD